MEDFARIIDAYLNYFKIALLLDSRPETRIRFAGLNADFQRLDDASVVFEVADVIIFGVEELLLHLQRLYAFGLKTLPQRPAQLFVGVGREVNAIADCINIKH